MNTAQLIRVITAALLAGALAAGAAASEKVYKWVDADGVVHYGQQPPAATNAEAIKVEKGYSAKADDEPEQLTEEQRKAANDAEFCRVARQNFQSLSGSGDVQRKDEYGQVRVLDAEEKATEKERAKGAMDRYCKPATEPTPH